MTETEATVTPEDFDLTGVNFYGVTPDPLLRDVASALSGMATEAFYVAGSINPDSCRYHAALLVQAADSGEALRAMAQNPQDLVGFVSEGGENAQYVTTLQEMRRVLTESPDKADVDVVPSDESPEDDTDDVDVDKPKFRAHATVVECGGITYVIAVGFGADLSQEQVAWVCESYLGDALKRGLLPGQATATA